MGGAEENTPSKPSKLDSTTQEMPTTPLYPDWSSSMQAYYGAGATPPYFASNVASPTPHPYLWGGQHPFMPPYGTPVPYPGLYPPGGVYAHPNMAAVPSGAQTNAEMEGKTPDGKDRASKKSTGSLGNTGLIVGKSVAGNKAASGSGNDGATQSAESGSDGSSDESDENANKHDYAASKKGSFDQMLADGANAQHNTSGATIQASVPGNPVVSMSAANLKIGMDLWNASPANTGAAKMRSNPSSIAQGHEGIVPDQWIQDERELKRQKRKQSNRESARRSRLRKQRILFELHTELEKLKEKLDAECEELQVKVENLTNENHSLKDELQRLSEECEKLTSENDSIKEELTKLCGPDEVSKLDDSIPASAVSR